MIVTPRLGGFGQLRARPRLRAQRSTDHAPAAFASSVRHLFRRPVRGHEHLRGDAMGGLQFVFSDRQRAFRYRCSIEITGYTTYVNL